MKFKEIKEGWDDADRAAVSKAIGKNISQELRDKNIAYFEREYRQRLETLSDEEILQLVNKGIA